MVLNYQVISHAAHVQLARPEVYNALNEELCLEIQTALTKAEADPAVKVVVLSGAGKGFCAGQDLIALAGMEKLVASEYMERCYNPIVIKIATMKKPVICRLHGKAAGAGASLALACDMVIAEESSAMIFPFLQLGLVPDTGASWSLNRLIGRMKAFDLFTTIRPITAAEALFTGLITRVVKENEMDEVIAELVELIGNGPAEAIALMKQLCRKAETATMEEMLKAEAVAQDIATRQPDFFKAVEKLRNAGKK